MREIEGIDKAIEVLEPHWDEIRIHFEKENAYFKKLLAADHDVIGRILKAHLIVEYYIGRYLVEKLGLETLDEARLTFVQKAKLLPTTGSTAAFIRPGVLKLNEVRNRFSHNLQARITDEDLGPINDVLHVAGRDPEYRDTVERIEVFMTIAATWLVIPPHELEQLFAKAFSEVRVNEL